MKQSPSVNQIGSTVLRFIGRYHIVIFSLTVVIGVSVAIFFLNNLISMSNESSDMTSNGIVFDKATIERIDTLSLPGDSPDNFSLPPGRVNPFVE